VANYLGPFVIKPCVVGVQEVLGLIQKTIRRRVLFNDDIELVTQALEKVGPIPAH
jgi:hypothetical protein